jgi:hypothetical protein
MIPYLGGLMKTLLVFIICCEGFFASIFSSEKLICASVESRNAKNESLFAKKVIREQIDRAATKSINSRQPNNKIGTGWKWFQDKESGFSLQYPFSYYVKADHFEMDGKSYCFRQWGRNKFGFASVLLSKRSMLNDSPLSFNQAAVLHYYSHFGATGPDGSVGVVGQERIRIFTNRNKLLVYQFDLIVEDENWGGEEYSATKTAVGPFFAIALQDRADGYLTFFLMLRRGLDFLHSGDFKGISASEQKVLLKIIDSVELLK